MLAAFASRERAATAVDRVRRKLAGSGVRFGGQDIVFSEINKRTASDLRRAEMLAFPILLALSFLVFRGLIAATLPLLVGGFAILTTFLLLRVMMSAQAANVVSLLITAVANTAANRRLTFGISGRSKAARHQVKGLISFGICLALTSGALAALGQAHPGRIAEVSVLVAANLVATVIRFLLYRHWVFGGSRREPGAGQVISPVPRNEMATQEMATQGERNS